MRLSTTASQVQERPRDGHAPSASRWRVSDLVLDTRRQRVWRDTREIPLPKLTYDLLFTLVRHHPTVISDDDLIRAVWPGLVVSQETVSQRVKLLRAALGDDSRNPRYVARLRGRGYHLVGHIEALPDEANAPGLERAAGLEAEPDAEAEFAAPLTARDELALLEPEWEAEHCDRPEWATTQVLAPELTAGIFAPTARPAAPAPRHQEGEQQASSPPQRDGYCTEAVSRPFRRRAWVGSLRWWLVGAAALLAVLIDRIIVHRTP